MAHKLRIAAARPVDWKVQPSALVEVTTVQRDSAISFTVIHILGAAILIHWFFQRPPATAATMPVFAATNIPGARVITLEGSSEMTVRPGARMSDDEVVKCTWSDGEASLLEIEKSDSIVAANG